MLLKVKAQPFLSCLKPGIVCKISKCQKHYRCMTQDRSRTPLLDRSRTPIFRGIKNKKAFRRPFGVEIDTLLSILGPNKTA